MAGLEELMAGLFGELQAQGVQDEMRRRRGGPASGGGPGYEGIGGPGVAMNAMRQYYGGMPGYDYSGPMASQQGGRQGLMSMLAEGAGEASGPAMRHFQNQGFDFMPPGQQNQNPIGGPNPAPGNIDTGRALDQPQANQTPGVPQGVARGQQPGQVTPRPQTQGWRNLAEGYSAAAQYPELFDKGGRYLGGAPAAAQGGQGQGQPGAQGGRPQGPAAGPGGGAVGSNNPIGGGGAPVAPGAGGGVQGVGQASGGKGAGGGGGGGGGQGPVDTSKNPNVAARTPGLSNVSGSGAGPGNFAESDVAAGVKPAMRERRQAAKNNAYENAQNGSASGMFGDTINVAPNGGNNNTPSETGDAAGGKLSGLSPAEKAARKAAWEAKVAAKQERLRVQKAPSASQFGANSATNDRGSGLAPIKPAGKTKPTNVGRYGGKRR